ncbi:uncharacterized protein LOC144705400 [Wolffia australiana]
MNQFYAYHFMFRDSSRVLHLSGLLFQEYVVEAYAKVEEPCLHWIRCNQRTLRASLYRGLMDQVATDDVDVPTGRMIILPPSFTGGPRYMQGLYQDAMAIVRKMEKPDLFIMMTCNPKWPDITEALLSRQKSQDRFDLCCRVFRLKLKELLHLIIDNEIFDDLYKPRTHEDIDKIVCAELPDPSEKELFDCVAAHMIHGPCGSANPRCPCMKNKKCSKKFPKEFISSTQVNNDGYPLYLCRNNGRVVQKGSHLIDNRWVVPYNKYLCKVFNCHINVEICSSIQSVKYLYKYVYKGHDRIQAKLSSKVPPMDDAIAGAAQNTTSHDEAQQYLDARYVFASEAFWRICEFRMQKMYPTVYALQVHDDNMQSVVYAEGEPVSDVMDRSARTALTEWMYYNREHPEDEVAKRTLYSDFPSYYMWNDSTRPWSRRHRLQCIGARCYEYLRTVDDVVYDTYQSAAEALGLLHSDAEFDNDLTLASAIASPCQICELFAMILLYYELSQPDVLFEKYIDAMSDDIRLENCSSQSASIIIMDEAPMMHRHVYEMLDRSIRDVMNTIDATLENIPFGGKVVVMRGDFRKMLPVIQKGSHSMIISSSLNQSDVWRHCSIFCLKTKVRVSPKQQAWSEFLLAVGEGRVGLNVHLPAEIQRVSSLLDLIARVYGTFG